MTRRVATRVLALTLGVACLAAGFVWGVQTHRAHWFPYQQLWPLHEALVFEKMGHPDHEGRYLPIGQEHRLLGEPNALGTQLEALGYAEGTLPAGELIGVVAHDPSATWGDASLLTSGTASRAQLIDMRGSVLRSWSLALDEVLPPAEQRSDVSTYWRRARLTDDGDVVAIWVDGGAVRLDADGEVRWFWKGRAHHDLRLVGDEVWLLSRVERVVPSRHVRPFVDDQLTILDARTGQLRRQFSLYDALAGSEYASLLRGGPRYGDIFHTNSILRLEGHMAERIPALREGRALLSVRNLNALVAIDLDLGKVVWASIGPFEQQHEPQELANGRVLLFDNKSAWPSSRVVEWDPASGAVTWSYGEADQAIASATCGAAHRLRNGNTLVVASDIGRAVEVNPLGEVVWDYRSPERTGADGELVATLFDMQRFTWAELPPSLRPPGWAPLADPPKAPATAEDPPGR